MHSQYLDCIEIIVKKCILKLVIERGQEKSKILSIFKKYKDPLEDFLDNSDIKCLAIPRQINLLRNNILISDPKIDNDFLDRL